MTNAIHPGSRIRKLMLGILVLALLMLSAACASAASSTTTSQGITFTVSWPDEIKCGTPVSFRFSSSGGSGQMKYRIHSLMDEDGATVYDQSYGQNGAYSDIDHWDFTFCASGSYRIRFGVMDMSTFAYTTTKYITINISDPAYPSVNAIVEDITGECRAKGFATQYEQALWLHDRLLDMCEYDFSYTYCSPEAALARGKGTCEAYHRALVKLLNKMGIETQRITSWDHVWTGVKLDGEWTQIDATWNDTASSNNPDINAQHLYFGLPGEVMERVHTYREAPADPGTSYERNYYIRSGLIDRYTQRFAPSALQQLADGKRAFSLPFSGAYANVLGPLTAYAMHKLPWPGLTLQCSYTGDALKGTLDFLFTCTYDFDLILPAGITVIEAEAFMGSTGFDSVKLPDSCQSIGDRAFAGIANLAIRIPAGVISIGDGAFDAGTVIIGTAGSAAEVWAAANGCTFWVEQEIQ
ncbi:MAG: leucine-rich repeat protein [Clostridia bacterium]|nr:leucine-rich repeat protein [Clostridia bacterium]